MINFKVVGVVVAGAAVIGLSVGSVAPVEAATFTGSISGTVVSTGGSVPGVSLGSPVTGSYSYNDAVVGLGVGGGSVNPFTAFSLSIGTNPFTFALADLDNSFFTPGRRINSSTPTQDILEVYFTKSALEQFAGATYSSQGFGFSPPPSSESYGASFTDPTHDFSFNYQATPTAVPTPALLPGLIGLGAAALRKRKSEKVKVQV